MGGLPGSTLAQQATSEVRGRVVDSQGGVLPGVTVTVTNQETGFLRETVTSGDGVYFISGLVPGVYEIAAELHNSEKTVKHYMTGLMLKLKARNRVEVVIASRLSEEQEMAARR